MQARLVDHYPDRYWDHDIGPRQPRLLAIDVADARRLQLAARRPDPGAAVGRLARGGPPLPVRRRLRGWHSGPSPTPGATSRWTWPWSGPRRRRGAHADRRRRPPRGGGLVPGRGHHRGGGDGDRRPGPAAAVPPAARRRRHRRGAGAGAAVGGAGARGDVDPRRREPAGHRGRARPHARLPRRPRRRRHPAHRRRRLPQPRAVAGRHHPVRDPLAHQRAPGARRHRRPTQPTSSPALLASPVARRRR